MDFFIFMKEISIFLHFYEEIMILHEDLYLWHIHFQGYVDMQKCQVFLIVFHGSATPCQKMPASKYHVFLIDFQRFRATCTHSFLTEIPSSTNCFSLFPAFGFAVTRPRIKIHCNHHCFDWFLNLRNDQVPRG